MPQYLFGTGDLYTMTVAGANPLKIGVLQDVSIDFSADIKQLYGQYQFPVDVARGKGKIEGKAATGVIDVLAFNDFYFGLSGEATGQTLRANNEAGTVPAMSSYEITVTNSGTFTQDLGVAYADTGVALTQVASSPAQGEYSVAAGVYTFNMADASEDMLLSYLYTDSSAGNTLTISNELMGATPKFKLVLSQIYDSKTFTLVLYSCVAEKLSLPIKQDDYTIADFSFQAQANSAGNIGYMSTTG